MRTLALDGDGDLALSNTGNGRGLSIVEGVDAIRQRLYGRLRLWAGEWFLDTSVGVPYLRFLGMKGVQSFAEATLRKAIATCPGIVALDMFRLTVATDRSSTVVFRARTTTGEVIEDGGFRPGERR